MNRSDVWLDRPLARRAVMARIAQASLGVGIFENFSQPLSAAANTSGKAKNIIYLFMKGAMSHLDTFDPKPGSESQGETGTIQTRTPGILFGEHLKRLAGLSEKISVVRSLTTETGAHEQGVYLMRTAYKQINSIRHPALGSWAVHSMGRISKELPGNVLIGNGNDHPGCGFLEPSLSPVPLADPEKGLENTQSPAYLSETNFKRRLSLADRIDRDFRGRYEGLQIDAYNQMYREAVRLMGSEELRAFNISLEPATVRTAYGDHQLGQGCLLARRLVESGVRFIEVELGGWDMHQELFTQMSEHGGQLDQAMATLLEDLEAKCLLDSTLVVLATEFGRTPKINENAGRDHHPGVFSCVLAGAGIRGGQVYGASDATGRSPEGSPVSIADFNTTIAVAAGMPYEKEFKAPNGRPFKIGGGGKPISEILA